MAGTDDLGTLSIGEYLLSLADGVVHAQEQLSLSRIASADGQQAIVYQIPRIDFELKMAIELSRIAGQGSAEGSATVGPGGVAAPLLKVRPAEVGPGSGSTAHTGAISTVKGSFVAVPVQGGRPPPVVSVSLRQLGGLKLEFTVDVRTTLGEPVAGAEVQFNVDRELSTALNRQAALSGGPSQATFLERAVVTTGANGQAVTVLRVSEQEPTNASVAVVIDVAGRTETVIYKRLPTEAGSGGA